MFEPTQPDKIKRVDGCYQIFFSGGQDPDALPIGTDYYVVYSPNACIDKWYVVRYRILSDRTDYIAAHKERELDADEIVYFEGLIKDRRPCTGTAPN